MYQGSGESVASADGIGDLHLVSGMFGAFVGGYEQAAVCTASDANQIQMLRRQQAARRILFATMFQFEKPHDPGEFLVVQLDCRCKLHRFREDLRSVKVLAKINIENAQCIWARGMQEFTNGGAAGFRALCQRSEADGACTLCQRLPLRRPSEKIPRDRFGDFKTRLTGMVHDHLDGSCRMIRIFLNEFGREAEFSEAMNGFRTENILAQAAGWNSFIPEERRDVGEVGGRSA